MIEVPKCNQLACLIAPAGKGVSVAVVQSREDMIDVAVAGLIGAHCQQQLPHASIRAQSPVHLGNVRSLQGSVEAVVTGVDRACSAWVGCSTRVGAAASGILSIQSLHLRLVSCQRGLPACHVLLKFRSRPAAAHASYQGCQESGQLAMPLHMMLSRTRIKSMGSPDSSKSPCLAVGLCGPPPS